MTVRLALVRLRLDDKDESSIDRRAALAKTRGMKILAVFFFASAALIQIGLGQEVIGFPASKPVEETRIPVFEGAERETEGLSNFRLVMEYEREGVLKVGEDLRLLPPGAHQLELTYEHVSGVSRLYELFIDGERILKREGGAPDDTFETTAEFAKENYKLAEDFTVAAQFTTTGQGTIFSKCAPEGKWSQNAKALFIRGGKLVYDIGWVGAVSGGPKVNDGKPHRVVLVVKDGGAEMFVDGKPAGKKKDFTGPDVDGHVVKIGKAAADFGGDWKGGTIENVRYWARAIEGPELKALRDGKLGEVNTPDLNWGSTPARETFDGAGIAGIPVKLSLEGEVKIKEAWVQPMQLADHAALISTWDKESLKEGAQIYNTLCVTCHGTVEKEGTLPTALKFHEGEFKNGSDPYRMYQTLKHGYGIMVPQPQYTAKQKYAVIHYIREAFLAEHNAKQMFEVDDAYLASLPRGMETIEEEAPPAAAGGKQYEKMDFGPALMWTYQVNKGGGIEEWNIAQKGIAVRLDEGPGGVSKGRAWMVYDEDTMRVAAAYSGGKFIDWRGIAFDGSHGTHSSIAGEPTFITPDAPGWQNPKDGSWADTRIVGRDGRKFGPLPQEWVHYKGLSYHGSQVVIHYTVGQAKILESPSVVEYGATPIFARTLNVGKSPHDLVMKLPEANISLNAPEGVTAKDGELTISAAATPVKFSLWISKVDQASLDGLAAAGEQADLEQLTKGGPPRFGETVITTAGVLGDDSGPFAVDEIKTPDASANPWESWMRLGGFDFFPDNPDRAAVCTWMGDVWLVDGVSGDLSELKWRRICSGLFQPLGLKIQDGKIYVTCRDQIARLHDLNGDEEIDFVESFNNDAQVTEHFHEFAMGLQTDDKGNFYYAKSARHAKTALVPHHGTLLRVSPDGAKTDIVATGFRAANGVCLNPDGTWIVTDQEGHWNPKNRINYVREGGFYGNMFGYHDVEDNSDDAMDQPLCWITNAFDRSPAELLWATEPAQWGPFNGSLLNTSYGYGKLYTVPHEIIDGQAQGGMCEIPIPQFATGVMRGRFHPENGQLYGCGLFAWAGSRHEPGGFYRIRYTGKPAHMPIGLEAKKSGMTITFSDTLDAEFVANADNFKVKTWGLKRTAGYGSKHYDEKQLKVSSAALGDDGKTVTLTIPDIHTTWCMEIVAKVKGAEGEPVQRVIHNTIHQLGE